MSLRKKLMVCGCSFSAVSMRLDYKGTAWSEVLADRIDWDLINVARQGCSNGGIRIQINEVLRQRPHFAIISATNHDRIEIPAKSLESNDSVWKYKLKDKNKGTVEQLKLKKDSNYNQSIAIENINIKDDNFSLICETIYSLADNWRHPYRDQRKINTEAREAVRQYVSYMYDSEWKKQLDEWIISQGILELYNNNINFIFMLGLSVFGDKSQISHIIPSKYIISDWNDIITGFAYSKYGIKPPNKDQDPGYHTTKEGQIFIAERMLNIMQKWGEIL